ncbi:MAG: glycerol-3-phosphate dehydrogenase [Flavobacteriales bacterium]|nr:MAG: glycerol-3-phosphate dehydrogenase [Flavobacteriales bacterium]
MTNFSIKSRSSFIDQLTTKTFDVIIVGGGITGAGVLLDAQLRGLSCCLIEMQDFSEGTSSRSTRLIHGGLRYLKQFNFKLVKETGKERNVVAHIARHLTHPKKVMIPAIKNGTYSKTQLKIALWIYEKLAQVPKALRHKSYGLKEFTSVLPGINTKGLLGGIEYIEYQTNDARLTIEVIKKGVEEGGVAISKMKVVELLKNENNQAIGVKAYDMLNDKDITISGTCIINATGPWADDLMKRKKKTVLSKIKPSKGVHLVFDPQRFPLAKAVYFDTPDNRMIFAIPEDGKVYVGTTDTFYEGNIVSPEITKGDVAYLLNACNSMFPAISLTPSDVIGAWSGVRPLIHQKDKKPSEISRKYEIYKDASGLLTIAGGKLTGYRKMAEKVVNLSIKHHFVSRGLINNKTASYKLCGSDFKNELDYQTCHSNFLKKAVNLGWKKEEAQWVFSHYGSECEIILNDETAVPNGFPTYLYHSLMYSLTREMVLTPSDFLIRRTNLFHFYPDLVQKHYKTIADTIQAYTGKVEMEDQIQGIEKLKNTIANIHQLL